MVLIDSYFAELSSIEIVQVSDAVFAVWLDLWVAA